MFEVFMIGYLIVSTGLYCAIVLNKNEQISLLKKKNVKDKEYYDSMLNSYLESFKMKEEYYITTLKYKNAMIDNLYSIFGQNPQTVKRENNDLN